MKPVSRAASPWVSFAKTNIGSVTDIFCDSITVVCPVTTRLPVTVKLPLSSVPLVARFSFPKSIPFPSAVIELLAIVTFPSEEPVPPVIVPVVTILLAPMLILALSLVIEPSEIVTSPNFDPLAAVTVELTLAVPVTDKFPVLALPVVLIELSPKLIALLKSVMLPLAKVKLPIVDPVLALIVELNWAPPVIVKAEAINDPEMSTLLFISTAPFTVNVSPAVRAPTTFKVSDKVAAPVTWAVPVTSRLFSMFTAPFNIDVPNTVRLLSKLVAPATLNSVPKVALFNDMVSIPVISLLLKLIVPSRSLIFPSDIVILPNDDPLAPVTIPLISAVPVIATEPVDTCPVVVNELSPKLIAELESTILPSDKVRFPIWEPDAEVSVDVDRIEPVTFRSPVEAVPEITTLLLIAVSPSIVTLPPRWDSPSLTQIDFEFVNVILFPLTGGPAM